MAGHSRITEMKDEVNQPQGTSVFGYEIVLSPTPGNTICYFIKRNAQGEIDLEKSLTVKLNKPK